MVNMETSTQISILAGLITFWGILNLYQTHEQSQRVNDMVVFGIEHCARATQIHP